MSKRRRRVKNNVIDRFSVIVMATIFISLSERVIFFPDRKTGMNMTMQWILYAVLIVVLGVVGYYIGKSYPSVGTMLGAGLGVAAGAVVSGIIWYASDGHEKEEYGAARMF